MDQKPDSSISNGQKTCGRCSAAFVCGLATGQSSCWCLDLPQVMPVKESCGDCLCPDCLRQDIASRGETA